MPNDRVYIHEVIDIIGHRRADYVHHMTANWSPIGQEERGQLCFGVFAVLGSTGRWPQVVNVWEHTGWDGLADSFEIETVGRGAQDPKLEKWWARASEFRSGGLDRILEPAPWTSPIGDLCASGDVIGSACHAHDVVRVRAGSATDFLDGVRDGLAPLAAAHGWSLTGAWRTAMVDDDEVVLLWSIPTWRAWAAFESAHATDGDVRAWRSSARSSFVEAWQRVALVDAPLSPLRTGRQPARSDRVDWDD